MNANELLRAYLSNVQNRNAEAAAALFADEGILELPTVNARAQGPAAIQHFVTTFLAKFSEFHFGDVRIWIDTPDRVFGEYDAQGDVVSTGKVYRQTYAGVLVAENGQITRLREALDTLAASRAFSIDQPHATEGNPAR